MGMNLFKLKEDLATIGAELKTVSAELAGKAANPAVSLEDLKALQDRQGDLQERFDMVRQAHDAVEKEQRVTLEGNKITGEKDPEARLIAARAEYIRASVLGRPMSQEAQEFFATSVEPPLIALPASPGPGVSSGQFLLPTNMDKELIHKPFTKNVLREHIGMTAIKGLELPRIDYTIDDDFIDDEKTAKELTLVGSKVEFGRNKLKIKVEIADTVLHGADVDLVNYVENALRSGLAAKERKEAFAYGKGSTLQTEAFYAQDENETDYLITAVPGEDLFEAVTNALADLHEDYRDEAAVCMRFADWVTILKDLANKSAPLYGRQPEEIIGAPVFFTDAASVPDGNSGRDGLPIVGAFRNFHLNYDPEVVFDSDKDVNSGTYIWVLTAWFDMKFKLRSAFRLAEVVPAEEL